MNLLVETTGPFQLLDLGGGQLIRADRPVVVRRSPFVVNRIAERQIDVLGQVNEEATDEEFAKFWEESEDRDLAIDAFISAYPTEPSEPKQAPVKKTRVKAKQ